MSVFHENMLIGASGQVAAGGISRSLRFNSADSAYLSRTPASAGNRKTWTWAGWVKRSKLTETQAFFAAGDLGGSGASLRFDSSDRLDFAMTGGTIRITTTAKYRDVSAWYHIVLLFDTTQSTSANRMRAWVNGVEQTTFDSATYPTQNTDYAISSTSAHQIGREDQGGTFYSYFNGYLADIHFIDGQALDPTSFTEVSATTGQLIPKAYTGSFGTNGFWLKFSDNSNNTAATLGKDYSGNSNNWTPNNLSVTAGAGNDSLVDTPTSYGTDDGLGGSVRGNYATLNPLAKGSDVTLVNGNLDCSTSSTAGYSSVLATIGVTSGKWYWEFTAGSGTLRIGLGIATQAHNLSTWLGGDAYGWEYFNNDGNKYTNGSGGAYGATWTTGDVIGVALDADAGTLTFYKNGATQGQAYSGLTSGPYFPAVADSGTAGILAGSFNFGQRPFAYTAPSGFKALVDTNLPAPVVAKGSSAFDVKLYTGNGSTQTISGLSFSPDLVWIKERNDAADHALYDSVRGVQQQLESNTTTDETTESTGLTAFNSDGFALSSLAQVNTNTDTYVAWCWDESATAGFDIVTYTGNGSARTISHGLGVAPNMIIVKARTTASTDQGWPVYHSANTAAPATDYLLLDSTAATADLDTVWNDTAPTSSVFSVGTNALVNTNNDTYVAYLFSAVVGYSSFGSYTGNGSTDGPFVYCGFRPRYILRKRTDTSGPSWRVIDAARNTYNLANEILEPNTSDATENNNEIDILSNGFKVRSADTDGNASGGTIIYAAFAESPFNYARAR